MTAPHHPVQPSTSAALPTDRSSRRRFLSLLAGGAAAAGTGGYFLLGDKQRWPSELADGTVPATARATATPTPASPAPPPLTLGCPGTRRNLVIIELQGGNDGLATLVPYGNGRLHDSRPSLMTSPEELVILDDNYGLHPALAGLHSQGGLAVLQGVGTPDPQGSHFDMEKRWWAGVAEGNELPGTGFLGRLCDELDIDAPLTGLTVGSTTAPILYSAKAGTMGLRNPEAAWFLDQDEKWFRNLRMGLEAMSGGASGGQPQPMDASRAGISRALEFADVLGEFQQEDSEDTDRPEYPSTRISEGLRMSADVLGADVGVQVVHVPMGGFDTHSDQAGNHGNLMEQFNDTLVAFRQDLDRLGLADDTLIATVSEFGRRPDENESGTDHGAASMAMLMGPVVPGLHGEHPSLTALDGDDNLKATVRMDEYYATLANWMGVDHRTVLAGSPAPITGLVDCKVA